MMPNDVGSERDLKNPGEIRVERGRQPSSTVEEEVSTGSFGIVEETVLCTPLADVASSSLL